MIFCQELTINYLTWNSINLILYSIVILNQKKNVPTHSEFGFDGKKRNINAKSHTFHVYIGSTAVFDWQNQLRLVCCRLNLY